jgi:ABC-type spermidine/putrescine transport system permease subunit II
MSTVPLSARLPVPEGLSRSGLDLLKRWMRPLLRGLALGLLAFAIFGPILNMLLWTVAERWFFPNKLPSQWGFAFWGRVFSPRGNALESLTTSVGIALGVVVLSLALAIPAGYALARLKLPARAFILLMFLVPQAFPNLPVYMNIARLFYEVGLNGTITGVILVHTVHGLVYAVWIATAAFAAVDPSLEEAARISGAGPTRTFRDVTLPLALPGLMASAVFVFLESLDEFTATFFVGAPEVNTLPLLLYTASAGGNYQIASITALILLVPSIGFMLLVERFLRADVLAKVGQ